MDIQKSFNESLKKSRLSDALFDISETSIDSLTDNTLLKQVPIVNTFIGMVQTGINIHDKLFLKKILSFLSKLDDISSDERIKLIEKIDKSDKYRMKVGEKLLYIIDSCADYENSDRVSLSFKAFLQGRISYDDFLDASSIVSRLSNSELDLFLQQHRGYYMGEPARELAHTGLVYFDVEDIEVDLEKFTPNDWDDPEEHYDANVSGGETTIMPTATGNVIYEIFGMGVNDRIKQIKEEIENHKAVKREELSKM